MENPTSAISLKGQEELIIKLIGILKELRIHQKSFFVLSQKAKSQPKFYDQRKQELALCKELEGKLDQTLCELYPDFKARLAVLHDELQHL